MKESIKSKRAAGNYDNMTKNRKKTLLEKYGSENYVNVELCKKTKLKKYGDENFNNREKLKITIKNKYADVHPVTEHTRRRASLGEIGFKSNKYKKYLADNKITNASQLESSKIKLREKKITDAIVNIFEGSRLNEVTPLFGRNDYTGTEYNKKYKFLCKKCNNDFMDNLYSGHDPRCPTCYPKSMSKEQIEILEYIKKYDLEAKSDVRIPDSLRQLDVYSEKYKIAIELNGIYWHGELSGRTMEYHLEKSNLCNEKSIRLLHITDYEWNNKTEIVKSIIDANFRNYVAKIFARNCIVKEITYVEKKEFLNKTHIQGDDKSSVFIGIIFNDELVSVMTFCKSRYDKNYEYELSRLSSKLGNCVVGGASKMFNFFIKKYSPSSIITYSDKRLFTGKVYEKIGMTKLEDTTPNYFYFKPPSIKLESRMKYQKFKLSKILSVFDPSLSEWENMKLNGYDRIWDCGNYKFEWKPNDDLLRI